METPALAAVAAVMGDRTRAAMLTALMAGRALAATELARAADVTKQTASSHLNRLLEARLVSVEAVGRHRYFRLAGSDVAATVEGLMRLARRAAVTRRSPGPSDSPMRRARVCYDHLAGELGVQLYDRLINWGHLRGQDRVLLLTSSGERYCARLGIDVAGLRNGRRALCLSCLDWGERRNHLAGALGSAIMDRCFALGWARRHRDSRVVSFSAIGERGLLAASAPGR